MYKFIYMSVMTLAWTHAFAADPAPGNGRQSFAPDFFRQYAPVTALDMVGRVPGFTIDEGNDRRGFADAGGNILIDGERPSTKSENIRNILARITADQVERIELIDSVGTFSDARGQGRVVNVVRRTGSSVSGTYEATLAINPDGHTRPFGSAALTWRRGNTTYDFNASHFNFYGVSKGPESVFDRPRTLRERRDQRTVNTFSEADVGGKIKTQISNTKINLNASVAFDWAGFNRVGNAFTPANVFLGRENFVGSDPKLDITYEAGGDIEFPLSTELKTKIIALYTRGSNDTTSFIRFTPVAAPALFNTTSSNSLTQEAIVRVQLDWTASASHAVQFGNEVALNKLGFASQTAFDTGTGAGIRVLPSANVQVQEWRTEPFVSDVWTLRPDLKLEAGLAAEFSRLKVSGDGSNTRTFKFIKPRVLLTYDMDAKTKLRLRAEREVAQLDFFDFATSVELGEDQVNTGNPDLVPEKLWAFEATLERRFGNKGAVSVSGFYDFVTDTQDFVPVQGFDSPGNLGASKRWGVNASATLPFSELTASPLLSGAELKWSTKWRSSRLRDPVTFLTRRQSEEARFRHEVNFRHDFSKIGWSYGADVYFGSGNSQYFIDEIQTFNNGTEVFAYIEYKKFPLGTLQFKVNNLTIANFSRVREQYAPSRASGVPVTTIQRLRNNDRRFLLTLSGKF
jgi:outer membrane receptor protein involved in Fe transport